MYKITYYRLRREARKSTQDPATLSSSSHEIQRGMKLYTN